MGTEVNSFLINDLEGATNSSTIRIELSNGEKYEFKQSSVNADRYLVELPKGIDLDSAKIIIE